MSKTTPFVFGASLLAGVAMSAQAGTLGARSTGGIQTGTGITALAIQAGAGLNFDTSMTIAPPGRQDSGLARAKRQTDKPEASRVDAAAKGDGTNRASGKPLPFMQSPVHAKAGTGTQSGASKAPPWNSASSTSDSN